MLSILDTYTLLPIKPVERSVRGSNRGANVDITATIIEDDAGLPFRNVSGYIDWNDGDRPDTFNGPSPQTIHVARLLAPGRYVISLAAANYRSPTHDSARINFAVTVERELAAADPPKLIFGPILPREAGAPGTSQWRFDIASDLLILESSVKMLLLTARGERVMEPDYGTDLRHILFETSSGDSVEALAREEIVRAMAQWEPRVLLASMSMERASNQRSASISLNLLSRLNQQPFETMVTFSQ